MSNVLSDISDLLKLGNLEVIELLQAHAAIINELRKRRVGTTYVK